MEENKNELVMKYAHYTRHIMEYHFPSVKRNSSFYEDMVSEGVLAMLLAIRNAKIGPTLPTYLYKCAWSKMRRYFVHHLPMTVRDTSKGPYAIIFITSLDQKIDECDEDGYIYTTFGVDEQDFNLLETRMLIEHAFKKANSTYGLSVLKLRLDSMTIREIAHALDISKSYVSRIINSAYDIYKKESEV